MQQQRQQLPPPPPLPPQWPPQPPVLPQQARLLFPPAPAQGGREGFFLGGVGGDGLIVEAVIAAAAAASPTFAASVPGWRPSGGAGAVLLAAWAPPTVETIFNELATAMGVPANRRRINLRTAHGPARVEIARESRRAGRDHGGVASAASGAGAGAPAHPPVPAGPPRSLHPAAPYPHAVPSVAVSAEAAADVVAVHRRSS